MDPGKVTAVRDWPTPGSVKQMQWFCGLQIGRGRTYHSSHKKDSTRPVYVDLKGGGSFLQAKEAVYLRAHLSWRWMLRNLGGSHPVATGTP